MEKYLLSKDTFTHAEISENVVGDSQQGVKQNSMHPAIILFYGKPNNKKKYDDRWEGSTFIYHGPENHKSANDSINSTLVNDKHIYLMKYHQNNRYILEGRLRLLPNETYDANRIVFQLSMLYTPAEMRSNLERLQELEKFRLHQYNDIELFLLSKETFSNEEISKNISGPESGKIKASPDCPAIILLSDPETTDVKEKNKIKINTLYTFTAKQDDDLCNQIDDTLTNGKRIYLMFKENDEYSLVGRYSLLAKSHNDDQKGRVFNLCRERTAEMIRQDLVERGITSSGKGFLNLLNDRGLSYDTGLIERFLISVKTKPFVILSGGTGNGKTALAEAYGEFLDEHYKDGCEDDEERYKIVPVGSNWIESRFITGYVNPIDDAFKPTPSFELIRHSNEDTDHPYVLILDEMNLSRVEYYFSDFLSAMESGKPIEIEGENGRMQSIKFGKNLIVIGTVNMDETTHPFSPKVLDRANVIEFPSADVVSYLSSDTRDKGNARGNLEYLEDYMNDLEVRNQNARGISDLLPPASMDKIRKTLGGIQKALGKMGFPMGYRTIDEMMRFLLISWRYEGSPTDWDPSTYLDAAVMQKVLPRIHGNYSNSGLLEGLGMLIGVCDGSNGSLKLDMSLRRVTAMKDMLESSRHVSFHITESEDAPDGS